MKLRILLIGALLSFCISYAADYNYTLKWLTPNTHTYVISLETQSQTNAYTDFKMPAWRPGRYILQDYAGAVSHFEAKDVNGNPLNWHKVDKDTWRVTHSQTGTVKITYRYFANNMDAGSSYYGPGQVYFNPINLFMYVDGRYDGSVTLMVPDLPSDWKKATALKMGANSKSFTAGSYHEFADSPTVFASEMKQMEFKLDGTTFYIHFQGPYQGGEEVDSRVIEYLTAICKEQGAIFGGFPFEEYHFIYRLVPYQMRHAVEHSNSASFALPASVVANKNAVKGGIAGISSHEFWHVWNVKRIRPAALWPYDYRAPQYTGLHWFTEGVTDYYTNLVLVRAGINTEEQYLRQLSRTIQSLENNYAASVISPTVSSFDSWLATSPYAHPDHRISYYTLGSRLGLLLDLEARKRSSGKVSLDDVFRYLYKNYFQQNKGVPEDGVQKALETLTNSDWADFFNNYVHGTGPIDYEEIFEPFGLELEVKEASSGNKRNIGIIQMETIDQGYLIKKLHPGGDAFMAGLGVNDVILEIDGKKATEVDLDDYVSELKKGESISMNVWIGFQEVKKIELKYTAAFASKSYSLSKKKKLKKKEEEMLSGWLKSVQD